MIKKLVGILVCTLLFGPILTCVNGIAVDQDMRMILPSNMSEITSDDIIFSDDFNDNQKDLSKWTEIYSSGTWEEINGRAEFKLIESGGTGDRSEGIQSKSVVVAIGGDEPWDNRVKLTWMMYPKIDATSSEGKIVMKITDGRDYTLLEYDRTGGVARSYDSLGNEEVCIGADEPWDNKLEICGDRYFVTMNDWEATVYASVFQDRSITLNIQLFIELGGETRTKYLRSGFDDIIMSQLTGDQPPNKPTINGPKSGKTGTKYSFTLNSVDPDNDNIRYITDWGDGKNDTSDFYVSGLDIIASHTWNEKGTFIIKVKVEDIYGRVSPEATFTINILKSKTKNNILFLWYQDNNPNPFPILQKIIQRLSM